MQRLLADYYRNFLVTGGPCVHPQSDNGTGFFRFGPEIVCYGRCSEGVAEDVSHSISFDASSAVHFSGARFSMPFDPCEVIENLRRERYFANVNHRSKGLTHRAWVREAYYLVRERLPVWFRRHLQRAYFRDWRNLEFPQWPVDFTVDSLHEIFLRFAMIAEGLDKVPFIWFWPDGATSCAVLTHDVETGVGRDFCSDLMDIDASYGFKASFQLVPEGRYEVSESFAEEMRSRGFEFNIHDLNHDGHLFEGREEFLKRAEKINEYTRRFKSRGFRAGAMYRNQDWFDAFKFSYDMSVPNVAHLEPQRGGCCTVMPYFVGNLVELPLTTVQDYSLFHILEDYSIDLWKTQIDLIQRRNGLISFICHPDYLLEHRGRRTYEVLLAHLRATVETERVWAALPGDVDGWWRARSKMRLVQDGKRLRIEGSGSERARVAYAYLEGDQIVYGVEQVSS